MPGISSYEDFLKEINKIAEELKSTKVYLIKSIQEFRTEYFYNAKGSDGIYQPKEYCYSHYLKWLRVYLN